MKVKPLLDNWEIPRISSMASAERRDLVELPIPGKVGSLFQDMNSAPTRIAIGGSLYGDEARDKFLDKVRKQYKAGKAVTFTADIVTATEVKYVVIEELYFNQSAQAPDEIEFHIILRESPPPPPPPNPLGGIDTSLLDQAGNFLDQVSGALDVLDALGNVPDIGNPTPPLKNALDGVKNATATMESTLAPLTAIFGDGKDE